LLLLASLPNPRLATLAEKCEIKIGNTSHSYNLMSFLLRKQEMLITFFPVIGLKNAAQLCVLLQCEDVNMEYFAWVTWRWGWLKGRFMGMSVIFKEFAIRAGRHLITYNV